MGLISEIKNFFKEVTEDEVRIDILVKLGKPRLIASVSAEKALEIVNASNLPLRFWIVEYLYREKKLGLKEACRLFGYTDITHSQHRKMLSDEVLKFYLNSMKSFFEGLLNYVLS